MLECGGGGDDGGDEGDIWKGRLEYEVDCVSMLSLKVRGGVPLELEEGVEIRFVWLGVLDLIRKGLVRCF